MATTNTILKAIKIINPNAEVSISESDLDTIVWENGTNPISKSDIEAKLTQAQNELDAEAQAEIDKKASGKQKLLDLGLTDGVGGKVLQVVQTVKTDTFTTTSTSFVDVTGLSATITPSSASSKILILYEIMVSANNSQFYIKLLRGSTDIYLGDSASSRKRVTNNHWLGDSNNMFSSVINYLDSPNTTSATTYKIQAHTQNASYTFCVNRTQNDGDTSNMPRGSSSITLMEVAG
jgi:YesN/AraC family two-component response regulator